MVFRKTSRRRRNKKFYNRKSFKKIGYRNTKGSMYKPSTWLMKGPQTVFPDRIATKMHWSIGFTTAASAYALLNYGGNHMYDPTLATASATYNLPNGYNNFRALYKNYQVLGSKIRIRPEACTNLHGFIVCPSNEAISGAAANDFYVHKTYNYCKSIICDGNATMPSMNNYMTSKKMLGFTKTEYDIEHGMREWDDDFSVNSTTEDATWYWTVGKYSIGGSNDAITLIVDITYYVIWMDKRKVDVSQKVIA